MKIMTNSTDSAPNLVPTAKPKPMPNSVNSMSALRGFAWLLALQTLGELVVKQTGWAIPGPVLGMVFLLLALRWPSVQTAIASCAEFLLAHLSLLFVPVGVGVMTHLGIFNDFGWQIAIVLVLSTWVGLSVTALALRWLQR